jgi:predicted nucleotidyltransferase
MATGSNALCCSVRARGDARPDSDYDVAIFLKLLSDRLAEPDRLAKLRVDFLDETDAFFDTNPFRLKPTGNARRSCTKSGVTPEASRFLDKARKLLEHAKTMLSVSLNEDAGRTAYLAGFHAAQAFIFEFTRRSSCV